MGELKQELVKFDVIYADPAWRYNFSKSKSRNVENQYPTMTLDDICNLPVKNMTAKNALLYLWATAPKVPGALKVIEKWGFIYVTQAIWDKGIIGCGYWFRGQHEILIVARKGKFSPPPSNLRISSVMKERRGKHSKKPDFIRDLIQKWFPGTVRLEMFCREEKQGWYAWGNEIKNSIDISKYCISHRKNNQLQKSKETE